MTDISSANAPERTTELVATSAEGPPVADGSAPRPRPAPRNLATLDAVRACAALAVVIFHMRLMMEPLGFRIPGADLGESGVQVFFVLSGCLIAKSIISPETFSAKGYVRARSFRILPLYYFSLVVVLLLVNAQPLFSAKGLADLLTHLLLVQTFFEDYRTSINGVLWTLSIEWLFYGFMLLVASQLRRPGRRWIIAGSMVLVGVTWRIWAFSEHKGETGDLTMYYKQLTGMADLFGCGIAVALVLSNERGRAWVARPVVRWVGLLASGAIVVGALVILSDYADPFTYYASRRIYVGWPLLFGIGCAGVVLFIQAHESWMRPYLRWSGLAFVGVISYSVYLFHTLVIAAFNRGWKASATTLPLWTLVPATIVGVLILATVTHYTVERPGMRFPRELRSTDDPRWIDRVRSAVRSTFG